MKKIFGGLITLVLLGSCQEKTPFLLRELPPSRTGVYFANTLKETPELNILNYLYYYNGAGVAAADFNGDGLPDLYFGSNQQEDALYLNKGGLVFEDITPESGITNADGWTTGVTHVDINGDGLLDLYICKASGYRALEGKNLLFVNQGNSPAGVPRFREMAAEFGLDFQALSTQAAFVDYDLDGDLDLFLMNHSVHPNRTYGRGSQREGFDPLAGDRLLRNDGGRFTDVSREAGIYQGKAGYGLGLSVGDLNNDGYPDLYVGNDFFENDYLYMNRGDGSFSEVISSGSAPVGHTTHFSMGNDIGDINNDGNPDILSLDMLPEDLVTYKTSGLEYGFPIYQQYLRHGYAPQYMQNTLQLNTGGGRFSEIGFLGGLASTEWSWGTLLADFDNDGNKDVFISNGIKGATNDMDYMNFIANEDIQRRIDRGMTDTDMPLTREIPAKEVPNYIFRNTGELSFEDMTGRWMERSPSFSHGCAYADLDRDGDLDLVVNNMDRTASVYENTLGPENRSLQVQFRGSGLNTQGVGARVLAYSGSGVLSQENYPVRGYLSAVPPELSFGLGNQPRVDSLLVIWPGGAWQLLKDLPAGEVLTVEQEDATGDYYAQSPGKPERGWQSLDSILNFIHRENPSLDFDREPLIAFAYSNQGPAIAVADFDRDGRDDLFVSGAKRQPSVLFLQQANGTFEAVAREAFEADALSEDTAALFFDADGDGWEDLLVASGGNEFRDGKAITPRLYLNTNGVPVKAEGAFDGIALNASRISALDVDSDGDPDLLLTADAVPGAFGDTPRHYLLENTGDGRFEDVTEKRFPALKDFGPISGLAPGDYDGDGSIDLAVAGHWGPVTLFRQENGRWEPMASTGLENTKGWWNTLKAADLDGDGDMDLAGGNWGLNTKFRASPGEPVRLYRNDFDGNGRAEPLVTYFHKGVETPFASRDELGKQMPFLNKKFRTYKGFAQASLSEIFGAEALETALQRDVSELRSMVFLNDGKGHFTAEPLPRIAQASAIYDFCIEDFNADGLPDLLPVGNLYEISTQLGRLDALHGQLLLNEGAGQFRWSHEGSPVIPGAGRQVEILRVAGKRTYVIARNNAPLALLQKEVRQDETTQ